ncbi:class I SAM-dependent methyltransferase [Parabacteroides sp. ASD2025]|uniref:class I SAM-dependent methyltransferase n=1 Tax=Parabacteroides sp. ASD2025 TaxID=3415987 RepID=UPI003CF2D7D6
MKNENEWRPTKYIKKNGRFCANHDSKYLYVGSYLVADLVVDAYFDAIHKYAFGDLADLGCGNVPLFEMYKGLTKSQTCIDWANTLHKNDFLDIECDLNNKLNVPENTFDTIILSDVLEHIEKPGILIGELYRVTRPNGVLILGVPFYYWLHEIPYDYFRYTEYALKSLLKNAGYKVVEIKTIGGVLDCWGDLTAKIFARIPVVGFWFAKIVQSLILFLGKTKLGKRIRKGTSPSTPLGYVVVAKKCNKYE